MATLASDPPRPGLARRLLGSPVVDLLLGPHGVDRYLELISPTLTVTDARAEVVAVRRQTPRSVTLTLRPNRAWRGFRARPVRRGRRRDRRRAPHPHLLPGELGAPRPAAGADDHRAPRRPGLRPPAARAAHRSRRASGRRPGHVHPARAASRAARADQRRQRHHAGALDAAHPRRRGPRRRGRLPALRPHRGRLALRARGARAGRRPPRR